ncbi:hypothetical protein BS78_02G367600 [Paspalum vaginatum]|nr:hypothetical protein BS78_02G367600 [Paspalum vaginatum]
MIGDRRLSADGRRRRDGMVPAAAGRLHLQPGYRCSLPCSLPHSPHVQRFSESLMDGRPRASGQDLEESIGSVWIYIYHWFHLIPSPPSMHAGCYVLYQADRELIEVHVSLTGSGLQVVTCGCP